MNRIFQIAFFIMLISFTSCEKAGVNGVTTQPTEVAKGTIYATAAYTGVEPGNWVKFYVCDISKLDVITTMITQMHNTYMSGNLPGGLNIYNSFVPNLQSLYTEVARNDYKFSYDINPGTYVLLAERYVQYSYPNVDDDFWGKTLGTTILQYKVIQVESRQTANVAFVFQDYISSVTDAIW